MSREEVAQLLGKIEVMYPGRVKCNDPIERFEAFANVLKSRDKELIHQNFMYHVENSPHPPTIAELVKKAEKQTVPSMDATFAYLNQFELVEPSPERKAKMEKERMDIRNLLGID